MPKDIVFELDSTAVLPPDEDEVGLARALERSEREILEGLGRGARIGDVEFGAPRRTDTGTDEAELQRVLELSRTVK